MTYSKNTYFILVSLFISLSSTMAQDFDWAAQFGGTDDDFGTAVSTDISENSYVCGFFNDNIDLDPGSGSQIVTSAGLIDMFVSKLNVNGELVWAHHFSSTGRNRAEAITTDDAGNVYVTGYFEGTVDFDPSTNEFEMTSIDDRDVFILKLDSDGNFEWVKHFGGNGFGQGLDITIGFDNNIYTTGLFSGDYTFDPGGENVTINTAGGQDGYVFKMSPAGDLLLDIQIPSDENLISYGVDSDKQGNIYATGFYAGTLDIGGGNEFTAVGTRDVFIVKYDENGTGQWGVVGEGLGNDRGRGLRVDDNNNIVFTGWYNNNDITFIDANSASTVLTNAGNNDIYLGSLNTNGEFNWLYGFGDAERQEAYGIRTDNIGNVYITGLFAGTVDFDPGAGTFNLTSAGTNPFFQKLDQNGDFVNAFTYEGTIGYSLSVAKNWDLYLVGYFNAANNDFDPGTTSFELSTFGGQDGYVSKFDGACTPPDAPTLTAVNTDICPNTNAVIDITAGDLNDATDWVWYDDPVFTNEVGTGVQLDITLTDTTTFYVRGEGACVVGTSEITINVGDDEAPQIIADDFTIGTDQGACEATNVDLNETITDNCAIDVIDNDAPAVFPIGETTVTWTITDESGNETIHEQVVTVEDQEAPVADLAELDDIVALCIVDQLDTPTATDNCDGSISGTHNATLPIETTTTVMWTYEDANGNISTQNQDVIIEGVDVSVSVDGITLTANNTTLGVFYRWVDCDNEFAPITNATNQSYTPTENGNYAVVILQGECQDTSECFAITTVGLTQNDLPKINVFPNPSTGIYNVNIDLWTCLTFL